MLDSQNIFVSSISIAMIPLLVFPLSFMQSWHCIVMCSALQYRRSRTNQSVFLKGRLFGYSASGAGYGFLGEWLNESLHYHALGAFAYFFFAVLTLGILVFWIYSLFEDKSHGQRACHSSVKDRGKLSFVHGLLMAFVPCPLLFQFFSLATLTGSALGGLLVGLAHGLASTPALWKGNQYLIKFFRFKNARMTLQLILATMLIFNLFYFSQRFFYPAANDQTELLFCF